jgi:P4 family phage/plasmid primase-like protien
MKNQSEKDDQTKKIAAEAAIVKVGIKQFLSAFYENDDTVYLRLFNDRKTEGMFAREFSPKLYDVETIIPELQGLNKQMYGVFFNVNGARTDKEVTKIKAQFFESDDISIEDQLENISKFPLQPSIIVRTRKSLHVYFFVRDGNVEAFRSIQQKLAIQFSGDMKIFNESRVLRIPGFNHCKSEPIMVECISFHPELVYTQAELEQYLPVLDDAKPADDTPTAVSTEFRKGTKEQLEFLCKTCDFMIHCQEHANILSEYDWHAMVTNLSLFEGGAEKIHQISTPYPRYSEFETNQKIKSFFDSGTAPMKCDTIAKAGFVCPNLSSCTCKSPAGLPFNKKISVKIPEWYEQSKNGGLKFMPGVLAEYLAENVKSIYVGERFYIYKNGVYKEVTDYEVQKIIQDHLLITKAKSSDINDVFNQWKISIIKRVEEVNTEPNILNLKNGLLDISTNQLKPFDSDFLSTIRINANFDPAAECPNFMKFLEDTLEPDLIPVLQQTMGYSMSLYTEAQKCFLLLGVARSGKSKIINLMEYLVGYENCSNIPLQELSDRFKTAELFSKVLNTFADLPNKAIEDSGMFKALVGSDMVMAERKNKNPFNFRNVSKLVFSANDLPTNISDRTDGFFRRLQIIRFLKQVPVDKVNPYLFDGFIKEADGIFYWALQGLHQLINNKFVFRDVKETQEELKKYRLSSSSALTFVEEQCVLRPEVSHSAQDLYTQYKDFCIAYGYRQMTNARFNNEIEQYYKGKITKTKEFGTRRSIWKGIRYERTN